MSPGSRPTPSHEARGPAFPPRRSGRGRRPGTRDSTEPELSGSGPRRSSTATRVSAPVRTGSTPRSSSGRATESCEAGRGRLRRWWQRRRSATGTSRSGARSSAGCDLLAIDVRIPPAAERTLREDVLDGLTRPFKEIPPKHFYDARGSELFEQICELPEYYPTRTERAILEQYAPAIAERTEAAELVELGAGSATKTRLLIDAMELERFIPVDVSEATVRECARQLVREYPGLSVHGLVGDFERHLVHLPEPCGTRVVAFLGGT